MKTNSVTAFLCGVLVTLQSSAQEAPGDTQLAKQSQNPVANLISMPVEFNWFTDVGPTDKSAATLLAKPVYPLSIGENWNLINRGLIPVIYLDGQDAISDDDEILGPIEVFPGTDSEFGLGNIQYQAYFSPAKPGRVIWGVGPVVELPTATDDSLGVDKLSAGPALVVLSMPGNWVVGALVQNIWDIAGSGNEPDVNKFTFQPIINYNLDGGWYLTATPVWTADWEADDDKWTIPVGGGFGRLMRFGKQPVDFKFTAYNNVEAPDFAPEWQVQFQVKWLFPKK